MSDDERSNDSDNSSAPVSDPEDSLFAPNDAADDDSSSSSSDDVSSSSSSGSGGAHDERPRKKRRRAESQQRPRAPAAPVLVHDAGSQRWWLFDPASTPDADALLAALSAAMARGPGACAELLSAATAGDHASLPGALAPLRAGRWTRINPFTSRGEPLRVRAVYVCDSRQHYM